jgi:hypothetical protein
MPYVLAGSTLGTAISIQEISSRRNKLLVYAVCGTADERVFERDPAGLLPELVSFGPGMEAMAGTAGFIQCDLHYLAV